MRLEFLRMMPLAATVFTSAACRDASGVAEHRLLLDGRLERGSVVAVTLVTGGDTVSGTDLEVVVTPADAVERLPDGRLDLRRAGELTISARTADGSRSAATTVEVALPPAILFDMTVAGNRDVYRVLLDGADLQRLTTHPSDDSDPTTGDAGSPVVFVSRRDGNAELYSLARDAAEPSRLTFTSENETGPALSRSAGSVAFAREHGGVPRLYLSQADGSSAARVSTTAAAGPIVETHPAWWFRGDSLLFTSTVEGAANLFAVAASGGTARRLFASSPDTVRVEGTISHDGARIAYTVATDAGSTVQVFEFATNRTLTLSQATPLGQPAWLRDGRLVSTRFTAQGSELVWVDLARLQDLHVIPLAGPDAQRAHADR